LGMALTAVFLVFCIRSSLALFAGAAAGLIVLPIGLLIWEGALRGRSPR
jgi:hypothetical protein